jgi:hypothetical protein
MSRRIPPPGVALDGDTIHDDAQPYDQGFIYERA